MDNVHISEKSNTDLKQLLDFLDTLFIGQKQNDVIICFNHCVMVGYDDLFTTDNRTYCSTTRQLDFIDCATHHPGTAVVTMCHRFNCFSRTTTQ